MHKQVKFYGEFAKVEEQDDGTLKVFGYASSESVDADGEVIQAEAMAKAIPGYMAFGAVREMHQPKAAGTAIEAEVQEDGRTWFGAHVVDSEAVKKVKAKVYKGFSIGGKITGRDDANKSIITGLDLVEISLVDRPANPDAVFTMYKAEGIDAPEAPAAEVVVEKVTDPTTGEQVEVHATADEFAATEQLAKMLDEGTIKASEILAKIAPEAKPADPEPVKKGIYSVMDFAGCLQALGWVARDCQSDFEIEGDNSPVPAAMRAWLADGVKLFKEMAAEEADEMMEAINEAAGDGIADEIAMAASAAVQKAGARHSKNDSKHLQAAHDSMVALGAKCAKDAAADPETTKAAAVAAESLVKAEEKVATLEAALAELKTRLEVVESQPVRKARGLRVVLKGQDNMSEQPEEEKQLAEAQKQLIIKDDGTVNEPASVIKAIMAGKIGSPRS